MAFERGRFVAVGKSRVLRRQRVGHSLIADLGQRVDNLQAVAAGAVELRQEQRDRPRVLGPVEQAVHGRRGRTALHRLQRVLQRQFFTLPVAARGEELKCLVADRTGSAGQRVLEDHH